MVKEETALGVLLIPLSLPGAWCWYCLLVPLGGPCLGGPEAISTALFSTFGAAAFALALRGVRWRWRILTAVWSLSFWLFGALLSVLEIDWVVTAP